MTEYEYNKTLEEKDSLLNEVCKCKIKKRMMLNEYEQNTDCSCGWVFDHDHCMNCYKIIGE